MSRITKEKLEREWMTAAQAAHLLGVSRQRVYVLVDEGRIRAAEVGKPYEGRGALILDLESVLYCAEHVLGRDVSVRYLSPEEARERGL